jgi:hypothetical protein
MLINRLIGVITAEQRCDAHIAFDLLRCQSQAAPQSCGRPRST